MFHPVVQHLLMYIVDRILDVGCCAGATFLYSWRVQLLYRSEDCKNRHRPDSLANSLIIYIPVRLIIFCLFQFRYAPEVRYYLLLPVL